MADFKKVQVDLLKAKEVRVRSLRNMFLVKEKLKKSEREIERLRRTSDTNSDDFKALAQAELNIKADLTVAEEGLAKATTLELGLLDSFQVFTDPVNNIQQLSDDYPLLLFPVRLETRFKKIPTTHGNIQHQLWVRIFPDDCSVDTFEDTLSEAEVKRARNYYVSIWSAGKSADESLKSYIKNLQKTAWKALAGNIQAGRAYWITENYAPVNMSDLPERESVTDIIFTIPTEELPGTKVQSVLGKYWEDIFLANGKAEASDKALEALVKAVGSDSAAKLIANYIPVNLNRTPVPTQSPPPEIKIAFIHFKKEVETKLTAWSQAARVTTLPERFVLMAYKGVDENSKPFKILNKLGNTIPDPLIIGPNPSLDTNVVLKTVLLEDYAELATDELKTAKLRVHYQDLKGNLKADKTVNEFIEPFLLLEGEALAAKLEQLFDDFTDEAKAVKYIDYLCEKSETKWLFDFEEAVKVGMGFKVDLSPAEYNAGFDRLHVLGVKLSSNEIQSGAALSDLIYHHHSGSSGFSIMPQGTATNNTEDEKSGHSESEDFEETFQRYFLKSTVKEKTDEFFNRKDGEWLTTLLGIDTEPETITEINKTSIKLVKNYYQTDQCEAKAMNTVLWSATLKYFMQSMMTPAFSEQDEKVLHAFFTGFVSGRGSIPAIRIGNQPYGILAINAISRQEWLSQQKDDNILSNSQFSNDIPTLEKINTLLNKIRQDFMRFSHQFAHIGKDGGADAHQTLLKVIGLQASSVEFQQRYNKSFLHVYNLRKFYLVPSIDYSFNTGESIKRTALSKQKAQNQDIFVQDYQNWGLKFLQDLGFPDNEKNDNPPILEKNFLPTPNTLHGNIIDDQPLSEINPIRSYTKPKSAENSGENYIYWLKENAKTNYDTIKKQEGFADQVPNSLLYLMLRHSFELEFSNSALNLHQSANILTATQVAAAKIDLNFIGIQEPTQSALFESRYDYLDYQMTGQNTTAQHISTLIQGNATSSIETNRLQEMVNALDHLKDAPTARLERAFVEHIDCCSYRLDAWLLGFVNLQLSEMRSNNEKGIYLGAYGWVQDLKPDQETLELITLKDDQKTIFDPNNENDIVIDPANQGYIHAPSIHQATTAAVLRNANISTASKDNPEIYKINLSSERVRMALNIIEGMQQGQSLGALLGYQLERGLHDRYQIAEVDAFIYQLRIAFPFKVDQTGDASEDSDDQETTTQIEEQNVVDGLALVNHINVATKADDKVYPFGNNKIQQNIPNNAKEAITLEIDRLLNINDALADLATAEGIHQTVQGNYERAAATLDTYSKGSFPQSPEVIKTPRSGVTLTNRVGIHLKADALAGINPRSIAEPAINQILSEFLPPLDKIYCHVVFRTPNYDESLINPEPYAELTPALSLSNLELDPIDLFYLLSSNSEKSLTALDDYILKFVHDTERLRPDIELEIRYTESVVVGSEVVITIFEMASLINSFRSLILSSRALKPSDITLPNKAKASIDSSCSINFGRMNSVFGLFKANFIGGNQESGIDVFNNPFINLFFDEDFEKTVSKGNQIKIINRIDSYIELFLARLHQLSQFGIQQSGFGFIFDRKATIYANIYKKVLAYKIRWDEKASKYDALIAELIEMPDEKKLALFQKAERIISTQYTLSAEGQYERILAEKRANFGTKLMDINNWLNGKFIKFIDLVNELDTLKQGLDQFDLLSIETDKEQRQIIVFAEDLKIQAVKLNAVLIKTATDVEKLLSQYESAASPTKKVTILTNVAKLLFGEDFKIIPSFQLSSEQTTELTKSLNAADQLLGYQKIQEQSDFPVDDWLYGIARVRDKLAHWENTVVLSESFNGVTRDLIPLQLPYQENDPWLGLAYPESYQIETDKLLYTAYLKDIDLNQPLCGLLIDEWTEVIPAKKETTGLSFQYDQSNAEPPQSLLLVTPSKFTGSWSWKDIVDSMHETQDLAKLRAIEPEHFDNSPYAQFLPATVAAATTASPLITIALNYAWNNGLAEQANSDGDENV